MSYDIKASGARIRQLRVDIGLTQEKTAAALNIDRSFYGRIESGQKGCSVDILVRLSDFFKVSLDYLVLGKEQAPSQLKTKTDLKADIAQLIERLNTFSSKL